MRNITARLLHYLRPALLIGDLSRIVRQTQTSESESNSDVEKNFLRE
jgi:hypothetical protein